METENKNKELAGELRKLLFGFISTTFGVLLALLINQGIAKKNDSKNYITQLKGIESELQSNKLVLAGSFKPNYKVTVIYRSLNTDFTNYAIKDKIFIENVHPSILKKLIEYRLQIDRLNAFREADEIYKYDTLKYNYWYRRLQIAWPSTLKKMSQLIDCNICVVEKELTRKRSCKTNF